MELQAGTKIQNNNACNNTHAQVTIRMWCMNCDKFSFHFCLNSFRISPYILGAMPCWLIQVSAEWIESSFVCVFRPCQNCGLASFCYTSFFLSIFISLSNYSTYVVVKFTFSFIMGTSQNNGISVNIQVLVLYYPCTYVHAVSPTSMPLSLYGYTRGR